MPSAATYASVSDVQHCSTTPVTRPRVTAFPRAAFAAWQTAKQERTLPVRCIPKTADLTKPRAFTECVRFSAWRVQRAARRQPVGWTQEDNPDRCPTAVAVVHRRAREDDAVVDGTDACEYAPPLEARDH